MQQCSTWNSPDLVQFTGLVREVKQPSQTNTFFAQSQEFSTATSFFCGFRPFRRNTSKLIL